MEILVKICVIYLSLSLVNGNVQDPFDKNELVAVSVLFRHGDRAVIGSYPNDPYHKESYWPQGYGELLKNGKLRQYNLGKWLRNRYNNFISKNYQKKEIHVESSNVDRCLMSAATCLAGLYKLTESDKWIEDLQWSPVPIHTRPEDIDPYLAMDEPCPLHSRLVDELKQTNERFTNASVKFKAEFDILAKYTGWNHITLDHFQGLFTTFHVYSMYNKTFLPQWAKLLDQKKFAYLAGLSFAQESYTNLLKALKAGPFFDRLLKFFNNAIKDSASPKFLLQSAHDGTVVAVLQTMGVYDFLPPEFSAMVVWELHKDPNGVPYMKLYYKRPSREVLEELKMPNCTNTCKYRHFSNYISEFAMEEGTWKIWCNWKL